MIRRIYYYIQDYIGWIPFVCALLMLDKNLAIKIPFLYELVNVILFIIPTCYMIKSSDLKLDYVSLLFLSVLLLSLVLNNPKPVFHAYERLMQFTLLLLSFSPLIQSRFASDFKGKVFIIILWGAAIIGIVSFVCYFLGINYMVLNQGLNYIDYNAGTFGGITTQSMILGPLSGIGMMFMTYMALKTAKRIYWVAVLCCAGSVLFAASRSAFFATLAGELLVFITFYSSKVTILKKTIPILLFLLISYPIWNSALDGLQNKNRSELISGIDVTSREGKWNNRIEEFYDSPVYGIGYATVSEREYYNPITGMIEPGSSWLAVLSMSGIMGFSIFCYIFVRGAIRAFQSRYKICHLVGSILIMLGIHMMAEGHIFSAGSFLCFMVWLTIGVSTDCKNIDLQTSPYAYYEEEYDSNLS